MDNISREMENQRQIQSEKLKPKPLSQKWTNAFDRIINRLDTAKEKSTILQTGQKNLPKLNQMQRIKKKKKMKKIYNCGTILKDVTYA